MNKPESGLLEYYYGWREDTRNTLFHECGRCGVYMVTHPHHTLISCTVCDCNSWSVVMAYCYGCDKFISLLPQEELCNHSLEAIVTSTEEINLNFARKFPRYNSPTRFKTFLDALL